MMKNYTLVRMFTVLSVFFGLSATAQTYCSQQATSINDDEIFNVTLGTLNNTSACGNTGGAGSIASMYQNYTGLTPPIITATTIQTISVTGGQCNTGAYSGNIYVWIDYNQNGIFTDPGEQVWTAAGVFAILGTVYTGTFQVPAAPNFGITRMRVTLVEGSVANPCTNFTWGEVEDYNVNVIANTPCAGTPVTNTVVPATYSTCPGLNNPALSLATQYTVGGIQYQWYASTVSNVGPFTAVPNATLQSAPVPTLGTTTWYQAVVTCTNSSSSSTTSANMYFVDGITVNSVPYYEGFENIQGPNRLPNCSWWATSINGVTQTYTNSNTNNRLPRTGNRFAAFANTTPGTNFFYSNGITMEPGITYSVGLWFATEYFGYSNWTNLGVYIGSAQTPTAMGLVAQTAPAVSGPYKALGGTFTVATTGVYYVGIRASGTAGSAPYLSWDDLSVTIPCTPASGNSPSVTLSASTNTICAGDQVNLNATGASTYSWSNGANSPVVVASPANTTTFTVIGTNTVTGCTNSQMQVITVNPSPTVFVVSTKAEICPGESTFLSAIGADNFSWSSGGTGNVISVSPTSSTTYSVIGTNLLGCATTATSAITVKPAPSITALSSTNNDVCVNENVTLTANGGATYQWMSSSSPVLYSGNPIMVQMTSSTTFTVMGTGANGCSNKATVTQNVQGCVSISENQGTLAGLRVYPNPTSGMFNVELNSAEISSVVVTDITGRVVLTVNANSNTVAMNLDGLASGVYYATVNSQNNSTVVRVIKD